MATVFLYQFKEYIQLVKADTNSPNINYPMIQYDIKVYKGVTNTIDFVIRNMDRKPINLVDYQISAIIQTVDEANYGTQEIILTKDVIIVDEQLGKARLILEPEDIEMWNTGGYQYSIQCIDGQGNQTYFYTDINKSAVGQFTLYEGMQRSLQPALELIANDINVDEINDIVTEQQLRRDRSHCAGHFTPTPIGDYGIIWTTGSLEGDSQSQRANGTHTIAVYTHNFTGKFWIQASLTNEAPQPSDWFNVPIGATGNDWWDFTPDERIRQFTFFGNYYWVRFQYQEDPVNIGKFKKILYKN
jgi:hypothetical protein